MTPSILRRALALCLALAAATAAAAGETTEKVIPMVDPAIDAEGPFCYLAWPNFNIGVMGVSKGSQVTFDGSIYAGGNELCFLVGPERCPVMARQKTLLEGWIPVIRYGVKEGPVAYDFEAFAAAHDDRPLSNTTNFVRATLRNTTDAPATATLVAANRFLVPDHRFGYMKPFPFMPGWKYEMTDDSVIRDGRTILFFPPGGTREAVSGTPYTKPFAGAEHMVTDRTEVCLVAYEVPLEPGEARNLDFRMPSLTLGPADADQADAIRACTHDAKLAETADFWRELADKGARLHIPEEKVAMAHKASLMYNWIAVWTRFEKYWVQGVNKTQYNWFWLRDGAYIVRNYDLYGHHETAAKCLEYFLTFQKENGQFESQEGQTDGFGQALFALGSHALMTGDREYAARVLPTFGPAIEWLRKARAADPFHIMPATEIHDNEYVPGHLPGHNFWALTGVRTAARVAAMVGDDKAAKDFRAEYDDFRTAFLKKLADTCGDDKPIPPSFDTPGGQDWGNLLGLFPAEVLQPDDGRVSATLAKMLDEKYAEGLMTYKGRLHHYLTVKSTQNFLVRNEQEQVLRDFYAILLHMGSCHEMFEWETDPWGARDVERNFPPHGWGSAMFNTLLRNMLVMERGGDGGLDGRDIHLFNVVSPEWARPGERVAFDDLPTELGTVSAEMRFHEDDSASVRISARWRTRPGNVVLTVPYWAELASFRTDARNSSRDGDRILLSADVSRVTLRWKRREGVEPLGYDRAVELFKREYARRFAEYTKAGHKPLPVEAPAPETPALRAERWNTHFSPAAQGIAVGRKVTGGDGAERVVDGNAVDPQKSSWHARKPFPRDLVIDLGAETTVTGVQVVPDYLAELAFRYKVEVSADGETWKLVGDKSGNKERATAQGDTFRFDPVAARHVRLTVLGVSWGDVAGITEVRVFGE